MDPTINFSTGLHKELSSILAETTRIAETKKIASDDSCMQIFLLQTRIQDIFGNAEFRKSCDVDTQRGLKQSLIDLERSLKVGLESRIRAVCNRIQTLFKDVVTPKPSPSWNQRMRSAATCIQSMFGSICFDKPSILDDEKVFKAFIHAVHRSDHKRVREFYERYQIYQEDYRNTTRLYTHGTAELVAIFVENHVLSPNDDPHVMECLVRPDFTTTIPPRSLAETCTVYKVLADAGYNPNSKNEFHRYPLENLVFNCYSPYLQAIIDGGFLVNPDPSANESPYLQQFLHPYTFSDYTQTRFRFLQTLLFNGALVSSKTEKALKDDENLQELLEVQQEAFKRLKTRFMRTACINLCSESVAMRAIPPVILQEIVNYWLCELGEISRHPVLRPLFFEGCQEVQAERRFKRALELKAELETLTAASQNESSTKSSSSEAAVLFNSREFRLHLSGATVGAEHLKRTVALCLRDDEDFNHDSYLSLFTEITGILSSQIDSLFQERLLVAVRGKKSEKFCVLCSKHLIKDKSVLRSLYVDLLRNPNTTAEMLSIVLGIYREDIGIIKSQVIIQNLLQSLLQSMQEEGRSLAETRKIFKLLMDSGLDFGERALATFLVEFLRPLRGDLTAVFKELVALGAPVNGDVTAPHTS